MLVTLDTLDHRPIYVQIVDEIRRAMAIGTLKPGELLPSARQLAVELRVNVNTVSQAYRELERLGVVQVSRGKGTFASPAGAAAPARRTLAQDVARRALSDAHRNGVAVRDLLEAIRGQAPTQAVTPAAAHVSARTPAQAVDKHAR